MPDRTLYYCVHVAATTSRDNQSGSFKWSRAFDAAASAAAHGKALLASGAATLYDEYPVQESTP